MSNTFNPQCPIAVDNEQYIQLAHGGGGRLMHQLISNVFARNFANPHLETTHDSAVLEVEGARLAFTTDSFVVQPLFFPGGDIGKLAICGTVNDLAMAGAKPLYLTCAFIIEEGFPIDKLQRIAHSMQATCQEAGVCLVSGDTKVVDQGKGDGVFINTAGIGLVPAGRVISPKQVAEDDIIIISGDIGRHGMAVLSVRAGLAFESSIASDVAPLATLTQSACQAGPVHCLRDLTRGGLATALCEIASDAGVSLLINEEQVPIQPEVRSACALLGLDPLYVANEGCCVLFVPPAAAQSVLAAIKATPYGQQATIIGQVGKHSAGLVEAQSWVGNRRVLDLLSGEQLPRIC